MMHMCTFSKEAHIGIDLCGAGVPQIRARLLLVQVQVMHMRGLGTKAMLVLAGIAGDPKLLALLRATLEPADVACLAAMAVQEAAAEDLDAFSCRR